MLCCARGPKRQVVACSRCSKTTKKTIDELDTTELKAWYIKKGQPIMCRPCLVSEKLRLKNEIARIKRERKKGKGTPLRGIDDKKAWKDSNSFIREHTPSARAMQKTHKAQKVAEKKYSMEQMKLVKFSYNDESEQKYLDLLQQYDMPTDENDIDAMRMRQRRSSSVSSTSSDKPKRSSAVLIQKFLRKRSLEKAKLKESLAEAGINAHETNNDAPRRSRKSGFRLSSKEGNSKSSPSSSDGERTVSFKSERRRSSLKLLGSFFSGKAKENGGSTSGKKKGRRSLMNLLGKKGKMDAESGDDTSSNGDESYERKVKSEGNLDLAEQIDGELSTWEDEQLSAGGRSRGNSRGSDLGDIIEGEANTQGYTSESADFSREYTDEHSEHSSIASGDVADDEVDSLSIDAMSIEREMSEQDVEIELK